VTKPNPENCKNRSTKCAYDCAQLQYTIQLKGRLSELFCAVLCIATLHTHTDTHTRAVLTSELGLVGLGLGFLVHFCTSFLNYGQGLFYWLAAAITSATDCLEHLSPIWPSHVEWDVKFCY